MLRILRSLANQAKSSCVRANHNHVEMLSTMQYQLQKIRADDHRFLPNLPSLSPYRKDAPSDPPEESLLYNADVISEVNNKIKDKTHGRLFAVIHIAGKQFKVTEEDVIIIQGYWAPDIGDRIRLEKVMLTGGADFTVLGKPLLPRDLVRIEATVIEKTLSHNKFIFRHKPRSNYRRLYFHKIPYSMLRINLIEFDGLVDEIKDVEGLRDSPLW